MKPPLFFDSNIYIHYPLEVLAHPAWLSAVVVQEMIAGARDDESIQRWEVTAQKHARENRLVTPTAADWLLVGKILNSLLRSKRSRRYPEPAAITSEGQRRIIRDALLARTVKSVNGLLVTENQRDFALLKRFCDVRLATHTKFFGS